MKSVRVLVRFPEQRYSRGKSPLEIEGAGEGSNLGVAINRAIRSILQDPAMMHKSPLHIWISVGVDGEWPIHFWRSSPPERPTKQVDGHS